LIASIPSTHTDGVGYFHSFAVTKNYIVFLEQPLRLSFKHAFLSLLRNKAVSSALIMNDSLPTRIHVIEKKNWSCFATEIHYGSTVYFSSRECF
jgi:carotenoid cleavage dioxygenase-like enzyme